MSKSRQGLLLMLAWLSACVPAPRKPAELPAGDLSYVQAYLRWYAAREMRRAGVTGLSLALVDDRGLQWAEGFGYADKSNKITANPDTVYRAGSISKLFTATAIVQLAQDGRLDLDAPLTRYLPEFRMRSRFPDAPAITLRDLLTHHAGLPGNYLAGMWTRAPQPTSTLLTKLHDEHFAFPPGTVFAYSNIGYSLLGLVVERAAGMPYERYMRERLLAPLGMDGARFATRLEGGAHDAKGYRDGKQTAIVPLRDVAAGGLNASVIDLARFVRMVLNHGELDGRRIIAHDTLDAMLRVQNAEIALDFDMHTGLGWMRGPVDELEAENIGPVAHHAGGTLLFHSQLIVLPEHKLGVAVMSNTASARRVVDKIAAKLLAMAWEACHGRTLPTAPRPARGRLVAAELDVWPGHYDSLLGYSRIERRGDALELRANGRRFALQRDEHGRLHLKYKLLGWLPVGISGLTEYGIARSQVDGRDVLTAQRHAARLLVGSRIAPPPIDTLWRSRLGRYRLINGGDDTLLFDDIEIAEQHGVALLRFTVRLAGGERTSVALIPVSERLAVEAGVGTGRGEVLEWREGGAVPVFHFQGYIYERLLP